jgi:hypothetical protein
MIFSKVDLPDPFRPKTPILAPGRNDRLIFLELPYHRAMPCLSGSLHKHIDG